MLHLTNHPVFLWLLSFIINVLVVSFTSPSSPIRPAVFPILIFNVIFMLRTGKTIHWTHPMYANLLGGSVFTLALRYFDISLLRKSSYSAGGPTCIPEGTSPAARDKSPTAPQEDRNLSMITRCTRRILWGISHIFDSRLSGTPWEVRHVPPFRASSPSYTPSKTIFLRNNIIRCFISVIMLDLARPSADTAENTRLFANSKVPLFGRWREITIEDIAMRFITTLASTVITYLLFQAMYSAGAIILVGLNLSPVSKWRPLFGSITEAYSLRRAWGHFWHQGMASVLTGPSKFFTFRVLRLPRKSLIGRYIFALTAFALSGAMHICGEMTAGIPLRESGVVKFFATQALGIVIEDAVIGIWKTVVGTREGEPQWWKKGLGFVWVVVWLAWSMPIWTYPQSQKSQGEGILPFSVVDHFKW